MNTSIYEKELIGGKVISPYSITANTLGSIPVKRNFDKETGKEVVTIDKSRLSKYGRELLEQLYVLFGNPIAAINYAALHKIT